MKSITTVLQCFLLIISLKLVFGDENTATILMNCKIEVGASDEDVKMIVGKKLPTTHPGFCLLSCLYEHLGIIKDGKFVVENLHQIIGAGTGGNMAVQFIGEVSNDCKDMHNDDKCMLSKDILMCAAESISRHIKANKEL